MASASRRISNRWLKKIGKEITGDVLSVGSMNDDDLEGGSYRNYFPKASSYTTSDVVAYMGMDMVLDIRDMSDIEDGEYDCIVCDGVLEHVDDFMQGVREMTRCLKKGGTLILGVPFRQAIHSVPDDFWRFSIFSIDYMLKKDYDIAEVKEIDKRVKNFPNAYLVKAIKK